MVDRALSSVNRLGRSCGLAVRFTPKADMGSRVMAALCKKQTKRDIAAHAVQHRREFLKIGYQACVDQQAIEAARFGPIGAAVK